MYVPSLAEYCSLSEEYNLIPVCREFLADTETPVSIYEKLAPTGPSFLLESVEGGTTLARYSFIGADCFLNYRFHQGQAQYSNTLGEAQLFGGPLQALDGLLSRFRTPVLNELPRFTSGAVGYFSYDLIRYLERLPDENIDDLQLPICQLLIPGLVLAFDHVRRSLLVIVNLPLKGTPEEMYQQAVNRIDRVTEQIFRPKTGNVEPLMMKSRTVSEYPDIDRYLQRTAAVDKNQFTNSVQKALEYIKAGDIFQVVLSQRFSLPFEGRPFELYRHLRSINPSPYLFFLDFGDYSLVGASPEMLVRVENDRVYTRPIAGTRPRGSNALEDLRLAEEMAADEKERAEHLMLVDLGRNDIGKVSKPGTVHVPQFMEVERYSHVMHLVSEVQGELEPGVSNSDVLRACFPAGTLSGAPKIRAMEIIEELEPLRRGPYGGAVGYLDFAGNMDTAITIRTALLHRGKAYIQSGAGIVADSDPVKEYQESLQKARAMAAAILAVSEQERVIKNASSDR